MTTKGRVAAGVGAAAVGVAGVVMLMRTAPSGGGGGGPAPMAIIAGAPPSPCNLVGVAGLPGQNNLSWAPRVLSGEPNLGMRTKTLMEWAAAPAKYAPVTYQVVRGSVLPVGGGDNVCLASQAGTTLAVVGNPPQGEMWWFLARGRNVCGAGSWGKMSCGLERIAMACGS